MTSNSDSVVQRLKLVKNMIQLGETSSLGEQASHLREMVQDGNGALDKIATALSEERYSDAVSLVDEFLQSEAAVQKYVDPRLSALRLEAETLEDRISELESEKAEIEREKQAALQELRDEVADLAIQAARKIVEDDLDRDRHRELVRDAIDDFPAN